MAGRPKTRARLVAEETERAQRLLEQVNGAARNATERAAAKQALAELEKGNDSAADRERHRAWWTAERRQIVQSIVDRRAMLEKAGPHPSELVALEVVGYGASGVPRDVAARMLRMSAADFELHYGRDYEEGHAEAAARAGQNLMRIAASSDNYIAAKTSIEIVTRRGGEEWKPPAQKVEVDDSRKAKGNLIDSSKLSPEDRQALKEILERTLRPSIPGVAGFIESEGEEG